jgi:hypothetical protein
MLKIKDAKPLFALSTLLIPWNFFMFGQDLGWGLHFPLVRFVSTVEGTEYLTVLEMYELRGALTDASSTAVALWSLAGLVVGLAVVYVVSARIRNGTTRRQEDRAVGAALMLGAGLFIVSRSLRYDLLLVGSRSDPNWFSVPFGAVYTIFVGAVFYYDKFRMGA